MHPKAYDSIHRVKAMSLARHLLSALFFGAVPALVFASGLYLDPVELAAYGMPVSLAALGIVAVGLTELARTRA